MTNDQLTGARRLWPLVVASLAISAVSVFADATEDLRAAAGALEKRDLPAAEAAFRRAVEDAAATAEQQTQALDGLTATAIERGDAAGLAAYLEQRRAAAPKDRQGALLAALVRACKARDGHFHGILPALAKETDASSSSARRLLHEVQSACAYFDKGVKRLESEFALAAYQRGREAARPKWARDRSWRLQGAPGVAPPGRPDYQAQVEKIAPPPRAKLRTAGEPVRVPVPQVARIPSATPASVAKPQGLPRLTSARLAAALFTEAYQKATELAGQGLVDSAKAEYATLMQLFPDSQQAQQAARYALALFTRDRALAQGGDPLGAYLQWVRAVLGPKGSDYAEHIAFRSLADDADPAVLAREAAEFLKRYPDSKWAPSVRLQLAVALDRTGATPRAIEVLKPLISPLDDALRVRAAHMLAWLYLFQGEGAAARGVLDALAAQTVVPSVAADARRILEAMTATPLPKLAIAEVVGGGDPGDVLAGRILALADELLEKDDGERAMDLYELYLRVARESQGFYAARERIQRIKRTGRADEQ
ncbi:MAG TPA: hypothetical protein VNE39_20790 [Planctomycetota bacterium]|nr:hypothetical protein [Planctomycetota bacterium]